MPLQVEDFKSTDESLKVEDFGSEPVPGAMLNEKTASQLAATDTVLTEPNIENYRIAKQNLLDPTKRKDFLLRQEMIRERLWEDAMSSVIPTVASPDVPDDEKMKVAAGAGFDAIEARNIAKSTLEVLAEEALIRDSAPDETEEGAESRNSMIDIVDSVVQHKRQAAAAINEFKAEDAGILDAVVDVGELIVPFAEWAHIDKLQRTILGEREGVLMGTAKRKLFEHLESLPIADRAKLTETLIDIVDGQEQILLPDGNDLANVEILTQMMVGEDYSNFSMWFDNVVSLLDVTGVGGLVYKTFAKGGSKAAKAAGVIDDANDLSKVPAPAPLSPQKAPRTDFSAKVAEDMAEEVRIARAKATHTEVSPASPAEVVKDSNPEQYRVMVDEALSAETDEVAEGLFGATKSETAAKVLLPEPEIKAGSMTNKVDATPVFKEPEDIKRVSKSDGNIILNDAEASALRNTITARLENTVGMIHKGNTVWRTHPDGSWGVSMRFSPRDSGYKTADKAIENAMVAFRDYGIREEDLTILERVGDEWRAISQEDLAAKKALREGFTKRKKKIPAELKELDYAIGLDFKYTFRPEDLEVVDLLPTGNYLSKTLDSISPIFGGKHRQGSLTQNLMDVSSVIHPQIANAATVAVDKSVGLRRLYIDSFKEFTDFWQKAPKDRRAVMTNYIHQANAEGIKFDITDLYARGFSEAEVGALKEWRKANDAMWYSANRDMVKTLRGQNYKVLVHKDSDTVLMGRPMAAQTAKADRLAYDPVTGQMVDLDVKDIEELYKAGGEYIRLASPIKVNDEWVDTAVARNTGGQAYVRALRDEEIVLPYRDGYYPVAYEANYFVEVKVKGRAGRETTKVVASAKTREEAMRAVERLKKSDEGYSDVTFRKDKRLENERTQIFDEGAWATHQSAGLTSQRVRGERVVDAGADFHKEGHTNLKDPLQAVSDQIQQLSQRVAMRTVIDSAKQRWMLNYGKKLNLEETNQFGKAQFPTSVDQIKAGPDVDKAFLADARTNFNYIYSLENGYINAIDVSYRAVLNAAADWMGQLGLSKAEQGLFAASKVNPTQQAKTLAYKLFLSANPGRQALIQRGQILQLGAINPKYAATRMAKDLVAIDTLRATGRGSDETKKLLAEMQDAGILQAVDAHNLTRQDALRLADTTFAQKAASTAMRPINYLQKIGFDAAEQDVLISSYLAHRDMFLKANPKIKNLTQRDKDTILGQARAFTLMMNRAGEMPYNQNSLGLVAQFFSFRHKAFLQPFTNKALSKKDRAKVLAYNTAVFGIDASLLKVGYDALWGSTEPNEVKDAIEDGLLDVALNQALTLATGTEQAIDFGDLAPTEAYGLWQSISGIWSLDIGEIVASAPASSLLFGNNPRLKDLYSTTAKWVFPFADYDDPELSVKYTDVVNASLQVFSGYSNFFKGRYAAHTGKKISSSGRITDDDVTKTEALMQSLFGLRTKQEVGTSETLNALYGGGGKSFQDDDVVLWYKELKRLLGRRGTTAAEDDMTQRIMSEAWAVFGEDRPRAMSIITKELEKDAANGDYVMFTRITKKAGFVPEKELWELVNKLPPGNVRDTLVDSLNARKDLSDAD